MSLDVGSAGSAAVVACSTADTWSVDSRQLHSHGNVFGIIVCDFMPFFPILCEGQMHPCCGSVEPVSGIVRFSDLGSSFGSVSGIIRFSYLGSSFGSVYLGDPVPLLQRPISVIGGITKGIQSQLLHFPEKVLTYRWSHVGPGAVVSAHSVSWPEGDLNQALVSLGLVLLMLVVVSNCYHFEGSVHAQRF